MADKMTDAKALAVLDEYAALVGNDESVGISNADIIEALAAKAEPPSLDEMVSRFLGWRLPDDFAPDGGISFTPHPYPECWPIGTNLLNDPQARAMLAHCVAPVAKDEPQGVEVDPLPSHVREAMQRMVEDSFLRGPASKEDGLVVAQWMRHPAPKPADPKATTDIAKMRAASYLLPDPGGEVVRGLLDKLEYTERVFAEVAEELDLLKLSQSAPKPAEVICCVCEELCDHIGNGYVPRGGDRKTIIVEKPAEPAGGEGWVLVPVEPTPEMLEAAGTINGYDMHLLDASPDRDHIEWWKAMLAAAPKKGE